MNKKYKYERKKKPCKTCKKEEYIFSHGNCRRCANIGYARKQKEKSIKRNPISKRSKNGQKVANEDAKFFRQIWMERPHYSEVSGEYLGDTFNPCFFSHVLTKGAYPKARHWKENIVLMTFKQHQEYEFGDRTTAEFKAKYCNVMKRYLELVARYYKK